MPSLRFPSPVRPSRALRAGAMTVGLAIAGGCTALPGTEVGSSPSDPGARVPPVAYSPVMSGARTFRPVEPKGWEDLNRQVAPKGN